MDRSFTSARIGACVAFFVLLQASYGFNGIVDSINGVDNNVAGVGRFVEVPGGPAVSLWDLRTTVANTDFTNTALQGGADGIQYVMHNSVNGSVDTNIVTFRVTPIDNVIPTISINQSPYNNTTTWNGGDVASDISQFRMSWDGGSNATIRDPSGQLAGFSNNQAVASGTWVTFTDYQLQNSEDDWSITLPQGVEHVTVNWRSSNPSASSSVNNEWVTFDANFAPNPNALPEPAGATMFGILAALAAVMVRRRK